MLSPWGNSILSTPKLAWCFSFHFQWRFLGMHGCDACQYIKIKCPSYGGMWKQCLVLCHEIISAFRWLFSLESIFKLERSVSITGCSHYRINVGTFIDVAPNPLPTRHSILPDHNGAFAAGLLAHLNPRETLARPADQWAWGAENSCQQALTPHSFLPARSTATKGLSELLGNKGQACPQCEIAGYLLGCQSAWRGDCFCAGGSRTSSSFTGADTQPKPLPSSGHKSASLGVLRALGSSQGFPASLPPSGLEEMWGMWLSPASPESELLALWQAIPKPWWSWLPFSLLRWPRHENRG